MVRPLEADDPRSLGVYRLLGRLGMGGQGIVYLGEEVSGRRVAVKVLLSADQEARAASPVRSPRCAAWRRSAPPRWSQPGSTARGRTS